MNNRQAVRNTTIFHSELRDPSTRDVIGHVVDVSKRGIRFISEHAFGEGAEIQLLLQVPTALTKEQEHLFSGVVRWCGPDTNPDYFAVGLMIDDDDLDTQRVLASIQNLYCFSDNC